MSAEDKIIYKYGDDNAKPKFDDFYYVSTWVAKKMYLKRGAITNKKGVTTIVAPIHIDNGSIFYLRDSPIKYYIKSWEGFYKTGGHIHSIGRLDGYPISGMDIARLKTKTWIQIRGSVKNKPKSCNI